MNYKQRDIQKAIHAALAVLVRLRAMKRAADTPEALSNWREALAHDMNDLNYKTQTL